MRPPQHLLLFLVQVAKTALAGLFAQDKRAKLTVKTGIPKQNRVRAHIAQVSETGFMNPLVDPGPKLRFPAKMFFISWAGTPVWFATWMISELN